MWAKDRGRPSSVGEGGGGGVKDGIAMICFPITFVFWGVADMNLCMNSASTDMDYHKCWKSGEDMGGLIGLGEGWGVSCFSTLKTNTLILTLKDKEGNVLFNHKLCYGYGYLSSDLEDRLNINEQLSIVYEQISFVCEPVSVVYITDINCV